MVEKQLNTLKKDLEKLEIFSKTILKEGDRGLYFKIIEKRNFLRSYLKEHKDDKEEYPKFLPAES